CESGTGLWSAAVPAALDRTEKKRRISSLAFPSTTPRRSESKAARRDAAGLPENVGVVGGSMSGKGGAVNMGDLRLALDGAGSHPARMRKTINQGEAYGMPDPGMRNEITARLIDRCFTVNR